MDCLISSRLWLPEEKINLEDWAFMEWVNSIWTIISFLLTLLIFSYVLGDNPLFRLASYLFVGVTAGYIAVLVIYQVILPRLIWPLMDGTWLLVVPAILGLLLIARLFPRFSMLGGPSMAYLVGLGAAVTIGGAVMGTLINQIGATINLFETQTGTALIANPVLMVAEGSLFLAGTISTLAYFQFGISSQPGLPAKRPQWIEAISKVGEFFIAVTLGALLAGVFGAAITALVDRLDFILDTLFTLIF